MTETQQEVERYVLARVSRWVDFFRSGSSTINEQGRSELVRDLERAEEVLRRLIAESKHDMIKLCNAETRRADTAEAGARETAKRACATYLQGFRDGVKQVGDELVKADQQLEKYGRWLRDARDVLVSLAQMNVKDVTNDQLCRMSNVAADLVKRWP